METCKECGQEIDVAMGQVCVCQEPTNPPEDGEPTQNPVEGLEDGGASEGGAEESV